MDIGNHNISLATHMIENTEIRLAIAADHEQIADLRWRLATDDVVGEDNEKKDFVAEFKRLCVEQPDVYHWVADQGGRIAGVMSVVVVRAMPSPGDLDRRWGYLTNCYVLPEARNGGLENDFAPSRFP